MSARFWKGWSVTARLLAIAVLPAMMMFIAVTTSLYITAQGDVRRDVAERGRLIATTLAQSSQYGLVSGNTAYLRTTLHQLLGADPSIACVDILDNAHRPLVSDCQIAKRAEHKEFEVPVSVESIPDVDLFEPVPAPNAIGSTPPPRAAAVMQTVGFVRVAMSEAPIFEAKRSALLAASGVVLGAAVLSCLIGLWLARRLHRTLASVMTALSTIRKGQFEVTLDTHQEGELGELQRTIVEMAATLDAARHELEQQVSARTHELQGAMVQVQQADAEKRRLITHGNARIEEERRRIAQDLHDHLGSDLISVRLKAAALLTRAQASGDAEGMHDARRIADTADSLYSTTRHIVKGLRPEVIDTLGLSGAVEDLVRSFDKAQAHCQFDCRAAADLPDLRGEQAMPAYRVIQEALTNVIKHSGATRASVALAVSTERDRLHIVIADNGHGFDTQQPQQTGLGLIGMRERVAAVGGDISITSSPEEGTSICVTLPMPERASLSAS